MHKLIDPTKVVNTTVRRAIFISGPDGYRHSSILRRVAEGRSENWAAAAKAAMKSTKWTPLAGE